MTQNAFLRQLRPRNASKIVKTLHDLDFDINCGNLITLSHSGIHIVGLHGSERPNLGPKMTQNAFLRQLRPRNASKIVKTIHDLDFDINGGNWITLSDNGIHIVGPHGPEKPQFGPPNDPECLFTTITAKKRI